jgi:hypothetical protein
VVCIAARNHRRITGLILSANAGGVGRLFKADLIYGN